MGAASSELTCSPISGPECVVTKENGCTFVLVLRPTSVGERPAVLRALLRLKIMILEIPNATSTPTMQMGMMILTLLVLP